VALGDPGSIRVDREKTGQWVLELHGEHDLATVAEINAELTPIADRGEAAVVDLSQVTFIDSAVLTALVASRRREDGQGARLAIVAPPGGFPARVLGLLQLGRVLGVYETRDEALASV
jgi:anti-sigma B factor antagonist